MICTLFYEECRLDQARLPDIAAQAPAADLNFKSIVKLVWHTWPFIRPQLKHLIVFMVIAPVLRLIFGAAGLIATDLFSNKIPGGKKLQPLQAAMLSADSSCEKAGCHMGLFYFLQGWLLGAAGIFCIETARVKSAAFRRINGAGNIPPQYYPFLFYRRVRGR